MKLNKNNAGLQAEQLAATFLQSHGLKLVAKNYHCRYGEIDLVMQDEKVLVFVEVRLRSNPLFGSAADSISANKQQKLIRAAQFYLQEHKVNSACRFDAVLMHKADTSHIEWIRNAIDT
jgi:putative endonuclease